MNADMNGRGTRLHLISLDQQLNQLALACLTLKIRNKRELQCLKLKFLMLRKKKMSLLFQKLKRPQTSTLTKLISKMRVKCSCNVYQTWLNKKPRSSRIKSGGHTNENKKPKMQRRKPQNWKFLFLNHCHRTYHSFQSKKNKQQRKSNFLTLSWRRNLRNSK